MYNPYGPYRARKLQYYHEADLEADEDRIELRHSRRLRLPRPYRARGSGAPLSRDEEVKLDLINRSRNVLRQAGRTLQRNLAELDRPLDPFATARYFDRYQPTEEEQIRTRLRALDQSGDGYEWKGRFFGVGQSMTRKAALQEERKRSLTKKEAEVAPARKSKSSRSKVPPAVLELIESKVMNDEELAPLFNDDNQKELTKVMCILYQYGEIAFSSGKVPIPNAVCKDFLEKAKKRRETSNEWNQLMLPRMPVPALEKTIERMLRALAPLVSPKVLEKTKALAANFAAGAGKRAQGVLEAMNAKGIPMEESYITGFWLDHYLRDRRSLMWNNTAGIANEKLWVPMKPGAKAITGQIPRAAYAIFGTVKFANKLWANKLKPTKFRDNFLDGTQFNRMFCTTRIPHKGCDELCTARNPSSVRHVIVLRKNCVFKVPVKDGKGRLLSISQIEELLHVVCEKADAEEAAEHFAVGFLTALERDAWAVAREELEENKTNASSLKCIDDAIFVIALDSEDFEDKKKEEKGKDGDIAFLERCVHGRARNRWLDKSLCITVGPKGRFGVSFEHSWGDGLALMRYGADVAKTLQGIMLAESADQRAKIEGGGGDITDCLPEMLDWEIRLSTFNAIKTAARDLFRADLGFGVHEKVYKSWGKDLPKSCKMSPDAACQLSIQLAAEFYRLMVAKMAGDKGAVGPGQGLAWSTGEAGSTAGFRGGRVERIRTASSESREFVRLVAGGEGLKNPRKLGAALQAAAIAHAKAKGGAMTGRGCDRHLYVLKTLVGDGAVEGITEEEREATRALFDSEGLTTFNQILLSTSTLNNPIMRAMAFQPGSANAFGITYTTMPSKMIFFISTSADSGSGAERKRAAFAKCLDKALDAMGKILEGAKAMIAASAKEKGKGQ